MTFLQYFVSKISKISSWRHCATSSCILINCLTDAQALSFATFGPGTGPIFLDNVACTGSETGLLSCPYDGIGIHNCVHGEDASVRCSQNCKWIECSHMHTLV